MDTALFLRVVTEELSCPYLACDLLFSAWERRFFYAGGVMESADD